MPRWRDDFLVFLGKSGDGSLVLDLGRKITTQAQGERVAHGKERASRLILVMTYI